MTEVLVAGRVGVPDDAVTAVVNVTAIRPDGRGFVTAYPCDGSRPLASTLNYVAGQVVANGAVIELSDEGTLCVYNDGSTDLVLDVTGHAA